MRALVLAQYHELEIRNVDNPVPKADEVLIQVKAAGICGSDVYGMTGASGRRIPPVIMGHEASGVITQVGSAVTEWQEGDRVTFDSTVYTMDDWYTQQGHPNLSDNREVLGVSCEDYRRNGAFAEFLCVPQHILFRIPDNVSFDHAALVEPAAVALHAINLSEIQAGQTALVVGTGIIGLFVVKLLKWVGCSVIVAVDLEESRLDKASELGATHTIHAKDDSLPSQIKELTHQRGVDHAFEVVGIADTLKLAIDHTRKGGTVTLLGNITKEVPFPLQQVVTRQLRIQGSCAINGEYPKVLELISQGELDLDAIISARAGLEEGQALFDRLLKREDGLLKVILQP